MIAQYIVISESIQCHEREIWFEERRIVLKSIEMNDIQLLKHRNQVEKDFIRLYKESPNKGVGTLLHESLLYLNYLCDKRNIAYKNCIK